ncbi:unnamed protein product [Urochloa humidicola]
MAEAAAWMVLVRQQVEEAAGRCDGARGLLASAHGLLDNAHSVAPAPAGDRARRAAGMVTEASVHLAAAASLSRAARRRHRPLRSPSTTSPTKACGPLSPSSRRLRIAPGARAASPA